ncbi:MAG: 5-formyltetrahydrofolate cyclo-ligase [Litorimonas sp.]
MTASLTTKKLKSSTRKRLRVLRGTLWERNSTPDLQKFSGDLPTTKTKTNVIAGYAPINHEIDVWPLLTNLQENGSRIVLPVIMGIEKPLVFREWTPKSEMEVDRYGVSYPASGETLIPQLILLPLLGFTQTGDRLGYGGGYYDRTLDSLRREGEVFACGVAYAGQEVRDLPTDAHDAKLDGILTENGFRAFR